MRRDHSRFVSAKTHRLVAICCSGHTILMGDLCHFDMKIGAVYQFRFAEKNSICYLTDESLGSSDLRLELQFIEKSTLVSSACTKVMKLTISAKHFSFRKFINAIARV